MNIFNHYNPNEFERKKSFLDGMFVFKNNPPPQTPNGQNEENDRDKEQDIVDGLLGNREARIAFLAMHRKKMHDTLSAMEKRRSTLSESRASMDELVGGIEDEEQLAQLIKETTEISRSLESLALSHEAETAYQEYKDDFDKTLNQIFDVKADFARKSMTDLVERSEPLLLKIKDEKSLKDVYEKSKLIAKNMKPEDRAEYEAQLKQLEVELAIEDSEHDSSGFLAQITELNLAEEILEVALECSATINDSNGMTSEEKLKASFAILMEEKSHLIQRQLTDGPIAKLNELMQSWGQEHRADFLSMTTDLEYVQSEVKDMGEEYFDQLSKNLDSIGEKKMNLRGKRVEALALRLALDFRFGKKDALAKIHGIFADKENMKASLSGRFNHASGIGGTKENARFIAAGTALTASEFSKFYSEMSGGKKERVPKITSDELKASYDTFGRKGISHRKVIDHFEKVDSDQAKAMEKLIDQVGERNMYFLTRTDFDSFFDGSRTIRGKKIDDLRGKAGAFYDGRVIVVFDTAVENTTIDQILKVVTHETVHANMNANVEMSDVLISNLLYGDLTEESGGKELAKEQGTIGGKMIAAFLSEKGDEFSDWAHKRTGADGKLTLDKVIDDAELSHEIMEEILTMYLTKFNTHGQGAKYGSPEYIKLAHKYFESKDGQPLRAKFLDFTLLKNAQTTSLGKVLGMTEEGDAHAEGAETVAKDKITVASIKQKLDELENNTLPFYQKLYEKLQGGHDDHGHGGGHGDHGDDHGGDDGHGAAHDEHGGDHDEHGGGDHGQDDHGGHGGGHGGHDVASFLVSPYGQINDFRKLLLDIKGSGNDQDGVLKQIDAQVDEFSDHLKKEIESPLKEEMEKLNKHPEDALSYPERLWHDTRLVSISEIMGAVHEIYEYIKKRKEAREHLSQAMAAKTMSFTDRMFGHFKGAYEGAIKHDVHEWEENLKEQDPQQVHEILETCNDKHQYKAICMLEAHHGFFSFRNPHFIHPLERISGVKIRSYEQAKFVYDQLYGVNEAQQLERQNLSSRKSAVGEQQNMAKQFQDRLGKEWMLMLKKVENHEWVEPTRFEGFIRFAIDAGKSYTKQVIWMICKGYTQHLISYEDLVDLCGGEFINTCPTVEYIQKRAKDHEDGKLYKNTGMTEIEYIASLDLFNDNGKLYMDAGVPTSKQMTQWKAYEDWFLNTAVVSDVTKTRTRKLTRNIDKVDHDYVQDIWWEMSHSDYQTALTKRAGVTQLVTFPGIANCYGQFLINSLYWDDSTLQQKYKLWFDADKLMTEDNVKRSDKGFSLLNNGDKEPNTPTVVILNKSDLESPGAMFENANLGEFRNIAYAAYKRGMQGGGVKTARAFMIAAALKLKIGWVTEKIAEDMYHAKGWDFSEVKKYMNTVDFRAIRAPFSHSITFEGTSIRKDLGHDPDPTSDLVASSGGHGGGHH